MQTIEISLKQMLAQVREIEKKYLRAPHSVQLLAVSKNQSIEKIKQAYTAGQRAFGENFQQEALLKIEALKSLNLEWHFIGAIQANKTKHISENFDWVHSISREKIAKRLNEQRPVDLPPLNVCIEVNIDEEITKGGIPLSDLSDLSHIINQLPQLKLRGLMAIPTPCENFEAQRQAFAKLRHAYEQLNQQGFELDTLSMGMSADYEAAIAEGATMIRIGTAIFGSRR